MEFSASRKPYLCRVPVGPRGYCISGPDDSINVRAPVNKLVTCWRLSVLKLSLPHTHTASGTWDRLPRSRRDRPLAPSPARLRQSWCAAHACPGRPGAGRRRCRRVRCHRDRRPVRTHRVRRRPLCRRSGYLCRRSFLQGHAQTVRQGVGECQAFVGDQSQPLGAQHVHQPHLHPLAQVVPDVKETVTRTHFQPVGESR